MKSIFNHTLTLHTMIIRRRTVSYGLVQASLFNHNCGPNAVVSFRKLFEHDHLPVIICLLTSRGMRLLLGNTSFIERVSDRSYRIAVDNLTGSILDSDIASALDGVANLPNNFEQLWAVHQGSDRAANVERIVAATKDVHASEARANPGRVKLSSKPR